MLKKKSFVQKIELPSESICRHFQFYVEEEEEKKNNTATTPPLHSGNPFLTKVCEFPYRVEWIYRIEAFLVVNIINARILFEDIFDNQPIRRSGEFAL